MFTQFKTKREKKQVSVAKKRVGGWGIWAMLKKILWGGLA